MIKSSIVKNNSIIDDEEPLINISNNNYDISIKNILEKNNYNITNNSTKLSKDNIKNNLYYFSNFPDLSKSFNIILKIIYIISVIFLIYQKVSIIIIFRILP